MRILQSVSCLLCVLSFLLCSPNLAQPKDDFTGLNRPYMGFPLPGKSPERFPGKHYCRFFNEGTECYFTNNGIWYTKMKDNKWIESINTNINYGKYADFEMKGVILVSGEGGRGGLLLPQ